jgi:curli production assembly/transport component CsgG
MNAAKEEPVALQPKETLATKIPTLDGPPITIAVYGFQDKTGQMKPNDRLAVFSKAVTQGAEVFLIKALQDSKNWFKVVERVGLDNLIKERQLIRNQREVYEGKDAKPLKPMTVAGVMIEGGIIGYDSNIRSGGNGARFLGIGGSQQYRVDEVVISLRLISVNSGEILISNAVSKTIYSTQHNVGVLRFVDAGTKALELENGQALNEPTTYAVRVAIEQAVYDMIIEGEKKGLWRFKKPMVQSAPATKEQNKDELVQTQTSQTPAAVEKPDDSAPAADEPGQPESNGADQKNQSPKVEPQSNVVPTQPEPVAVVTEQSESPGLATPRYLKQDSFVYKEADEKSQKTWLLKKGTEFIAVLSGPDSWHYVVDAKKRKGYVRTEMLLSHKPR